MHTIDLVNLPLSLNSLPRKPHNNALNREESHTHTSQLLNAFKNVLALRLIGKRKRKEVEIATSKT